MLGVNHPSKGLMPQIRQPTDMYCCCSMSAADATAAAAGTSSAEVENPCTAEGVFEGGGLFMKKQ